MLKMFYEYNGNIYGVRKISDLYVYLFDIVTDAIRKIFITEIEKMKKF